MSEAVRVYIYDKCSTCRDALKFLKDNGIPHESLPIREQPPSVSELRQMLQAAGDLRRLFNTSGMDYRAMNLKDRLPGMTTDEALELLSTHGNLVKRPFLLTKDGGLTGFKPVEWEALLGR
jgi:arsenate reductase